MTVVDVRPRAVRNEWYKTNSRRNMYAQRIDTMTRTRHNRRNGLTLLETLLSIALTSLVLYLVSMAIDLHLRVLERRGEQVEQAQLARVLLRQIADDLRSVVYAQPDDEATLSDSGQSEADSGSGAASSSTSSDIIGLTAFPTKPGLYGDRYEIQVDVSRLPRPDQYQAWLSDESGALSDAVSDVKNIAYYLRTESSSSRSGDSDDEDSRGGLVRRTLDRAATKWAVESGNLVGLDERAQLMAHEVAALEFRYFDGIEWLEEWDSETFGGLPIAVDVTIELLPGETEPIDETDVSTRGPGDVLQGERVYRLIVRIPTADVMDLYSDEETGGTSP